MSFTLEHWNGDLIGLFDSVDAAKQGVPLVSEWRQDEHRDMGWNGWLPDPRPGGAPDYKITWIGASAGGFFQADPAKGGVQTSQKAGLT